VRQVTQRNAGRATAGVDGQVALTSRARMEQSVIAHADGPTPDAARLVHSHCQRGATGAQKDLALLCLTPPPGLA
jgi:hypothetical protein